MYLFLKCFFGGGNMVDEFFGGVVVFIVLNFIYWFDGIM